MSSCRYPVETQPWGVRSGARTGWKRGHATVCPYPIAGVRDAGGRCHAEHSPPPRCRHPGGARRPAPGRCTVACRPRPRGPSRPADRRLGTVRSPADAAARPDPQQGRPARQPVPDVPAVGRVERSGPAHTGGGSTFPARGRRRRRARGRLGLPLRRCGPRQELRRRRPDRGHAQCGRGERGARAHRARPRPVRGARPRPGRAVREEHTGVRARAGRKPPVPLGAPRHRTVEHVPAAPCGTRADHALDPCGTGHGRHPERPRRRIRRAPRVGTRHPGHRLRHRPRNEAGRNLAEAVAAERLPRVVVMGDFNGTSEDTALKPLTSQLRSAQREAGAGFGFTWPASTPLVRIDQILVRGVSPASSWTLPATGSDHLPVAASLRL
ncbi:endonuclease/exonuclease/phosphatase family protein [Streptomyces zaomyceticus]|uniref:endonuclease/exonuclease/phosphatase family protein n=1 Tax=Streptomyces zaomyceticus TaxID=68286 RepID=UPI0037240F26